MMAAERAGAPPPGAAPGDEPRRCDRCGAKLRRRLFGNRVEALADYNARRFCGPKCAGPGRSLRERRNKTTESYRARKHLKSSCEACGETRHLVAHHLDQDHHNNLPQNIQTLCSYCHDFWHSLADRRRRPVAGRMPRLF
jgi:5-methylcytosine-specific restriction endonuclease McrA